MQAWYEDLKQVFNLEITVNFINRDKKEIEYHIFITNKTRTISLIYIMVTKE